MAPFRSFTHAASMIAIYAPVLAFGATATLVGGSFDLMFFNGFTVRGVVSNGSVKWPATQFTDLACGMGLAKAQVNAVYTRGSFGQGSFEACLRDLPVGSAVPPKIWGRLML
ncbi:MAG: hypothetical protein N2444_09390 [Methylocystis sp.]|nr:hypothetical protein [Methylocystis sp.]